MTDQEPKMRPLNLRVPDSLYEWLESEATQEQMNVSELVRYFLLGIKRRGEK